MELGSKRERENNIDTHRQLQEKEIDMKDTDDRKRNKTERSKLIYRYNLADRRETD